eukprot:gene944-498_t
MLGRISPVSNTSGAQSSAAEPHQTFQDANDLVEAFYRSWKDRFNNRNPKNLMQNAEDLLELSRGLTKSLTNSLDPIFSLPTTTPLRSPRVTNVYSGKTLIEEKVKLECQNAEYFWHRPEMSEVDQQVNDRAVKRIFINGCFDCVHPGHFNAIRQAKATFSEPGVDCVLIVGVHSVEGITGQKGPPVLTDEERIAVVRNVKWVDELVTYLPYMEMSPAFLDSIKADYCVHGDDLPIIKGGGKGNHTTKMAYFIALDDIGYNWIPSTKIVSLRSDSQTFCVK